MSDIMFSSSSLHITLQYYNNIYQLSCSYNTLSTFLLQYNSSSHVSKTFHFQSNTPPCMHVRNSSIMTLKFTCSASYLHPDRLGDAVGEIWQCSHCNTLHHRRAPRPPMLGWRMPNCQGPHERGCGRPRHGR